MSPASNYLNIQLSPAYEFIPPAGIKPFSRNEELLIKPWGTVEDKNIEIFLDYAVLMEILKRSKNPMHHEVGGFLIGYAKQENNNFFIEITDTALAQETQAATDEVAFTHQTWKLIDAQMAGRFKDKQIVGWFHTHPGRGLFLSPEDKFVHNNFFPYPWQVALVVDPATGHQMFFQKKGVKMVASGFFLYGPKEKIDLLRHLVRELKTAEKRDKSGRYRAHHVYIK